MEHEIKTNPPSQQEVLKNAQKGDVTATPEVAVLSKSNSSSKPKIDVEQELNYQKKYLRQGKISQGVEYYTKLAEDHPQDAKALFLCGNFLLATNQSQQIEEGRGYIETALDFDAKIPYAHLGMGLYHELKKDYAKSELSYKKALQQNPAFTRAKLGLARIALFRRNLEEGILLAEEVIKIDPKEPMAYLILAKIQAETSANKALKTLQKGIQVIPEEADLYKALGHFSVSNHQVEDAIRYFKTYVQLVPDAVDAKDVEKHIEYFEKQFKKERERLNLLIQELTNFGVPYENRRRAAKAVIELPAWEESIYQAVFKALKQDEDYGVRIFCVRGLSKFAPKAEVIDLFLEKLKDDHHYQVRTTIVKSLGDLQVKRAVPLIIKVLEEEDSYFMDIANQTLIILTGTKYEFRPELEIDPQKQKEYLKKAQNFWKQWAAENQSWIQANS